MSFLSAFFKEFFPNTHKFLFPAVFSAHGTPQNIGVGKIQPGKMVAYFQDIFLVNHYTERFAELFPENGMEILKIIGMVKPADVRAHHPRTGYPRADDGTGRHKGPVILTSQFFQQAAHGRTFDVKTTGCFAFA